MAKLSEEAKAYTPKQTYNIADLESVSVDMDVQDDEFQTQDENGNEKTVKQKVIEVDGHKYRVPKTVLNQLKVLLEDNQNLKRFKVKKSGQGMNTDYTVIPLTGSGENQNVPVEKPGQ